MFGAFLIFLVLQSLFGWQTHNDELVQAGVRPEGYLGYLGTGHFAEAVFENWESEFLQMGAYVLLTVYLVQRGSAESKPDPAQERPGDNPRGAKSTSPRPVRGGGVEAGQHPARRDRGVTARQDRAPGHHGDAEAG